MLATTGQQVTQIPPFLEQFGLPQPDVWLGRGSGGRDLATNRDIPGWLARVGRSFGRERGRLATARSPSGPGRPLVLVHGDTMTTVLGATMGRALRAPVAHIEGGLRSGDLRNPFPRSSTAGSRAAVAHIHYAPGAWAAANLAGAGSSSTPARTPSATASSWSHDRRDVRLPPDEPFGIVSLHRFELLSSRQLLTETIDVAR